MNWREQRRGELLRLGATDPALLTIRYYELAQQGDAPHASGAKISLTAMIDAIMNEEEILNHLESHTPRPIAAGRGL